MLKSHLIALASAFCVSVSAALPAHPRLLVSEKDWAALPARMESDKMVREIVRATIARADSVMEAPTLTHELTGRRMLSVSRDALERVLDLATAWKVSGERKYLERCRAELLAVCAFSDWHPIHHLDTAEMQTAVSIGYDWLFAELTRDERKAIETALLEKGLRETFNYKSLQRRTNNWNQVCMGGMVLSSIALMDVEPEMCMQALDEARAAIKVGLAGSYPPDGTYSEGGGYWHYGTEYSVLAIEALRSAGFPDAGALAHPGFLESGRYILQVHGTSGLLFNYGDTHERSLGTSPALLWMARENRSAALRDFAATPFLRIDPEKTNRFLALAAFWAPSEDNMKEDKPPLHHLGGGHSPVAIHRTGYGKEDLFLGIKAGKADVPHGHMDAGSFVDDWGGERWAADLGSQDYHSLEEKGIVLFDMEQESRRWSVNRLNNFSHNTLTYNGRLHDVYGEAEILSSVGPPASETLLDMAAPLGLPKGASAKRRFKMDVKTKRVTVADTLEGLLPGDKITWHMMTRAEVAETEGGVSLARHGKRMTLTLTSPQRVSLKISPADPPPAAHDEPNPGMTRILFETVAGKDGKVAVEAVFQAKE